MVRVTRDRPKLVFVPASNDMSHFIPGSWGISGGGDFLVTDEMYLKLHQFTDPSLKIPDDPEEGLGKTLAELMGNTYADRVNRALSLNPRGSMLWEFNVLAPNMTDYIRQFAVLGEPFIVFPTILDRIKRPILQLAANILNRLRYFKVKKECAEWDKFLQEVHRERAAK